MGIHPPYDQFVSDVGTDYKIAAAQLLFTEYDGHNTGAVSRGVTRIVGRPIQYVGLDSLPHRLLPGSVGLSELEIEDHANILRRIATNEMPDQIDFIRNWNWTESGQICTVTSSSARVNKPMDASLPCRMSGDFWVRAAVIATAPHGADPKEVWGAISGLKSAELKYIPSGIWGEIYNFGHELSHVLQLSHQAILRYDLPWEWETEIDADEGSIAGLKILASSQFSHFEKEIEETIQAVKHGRAVSGFRAAEPTYWSALRLDGNKNVTYDQAVLSGYELRFRVYAEIKKIEISESSTEIQALIKQWLPRPRRNDRMSRILSQAFGAPFKWKDITLDDSRPALQKVITSGKIDDPLTLRNAELVMDGMRYFQEGPQHKWEPQPVFQQTGSSPQFTRQNVYAAPNMT